MNLIATLDFENTGTSTAGFMERTAVRAVLTDESGMIALMHTKRDGFYNLPGGGVEEGETLMDALVRECKEETGYNVEILRELGSIVEIRKEERVVQTSTCYLARVNGPQGEPALTQKEFERQLHVVWAPFDEALEKVSVVVHESSTARCVAARESLILKRSNGMI